MKEREKELKKQIGERVRKLRTGAGLSMEEFAQRIHATSATISNIENGKSIPGGAILLNISKAFHVSSDWILRGTLPENEQVYEKNDRLIFFHDKWQIFCRSSHYMTEDDKHRQEAILSLIEKITLLSERDIELLGVLLSRLTGKDAP
ncbi:helix-turn-helix domain-containing protein [Thermicanus aegyptius]|uniref:helix-turn-helix domain-containing protein n=1 Tax=Thermicanus aegyptius TaxID=94009 RepID=UPI0006886F55|nr:helix-turn-helix transcriptional regulator [Thermicanus aegyptius]